ncbi:serine hydrolase domain-containing protein [Brevibacillus sp. SYSU BS000544]|uniref:serine hydrolase domain-containing protein n=1 Tax=Brevibacillus sp. SYSU BS000544 TaxID=3416443 RepID=UPI003CE4F26A
MDNPLDQSLQELMQKHQIVGLSAAVVKDNRLIWSNTYGKADLERGQPVTGSTVFRIASISKTIAATALMQLYEQALCKLDEDISNYLGFLVRNPRYPEHPVTLTYLLTHTSGLQDVYVDFVVASRTENPPTIHLREALLPEGRFYTDELWGELAPGDPASYEYSNLGAVIIATIVESLSGERFDQYCKRHIFKPLEMKDTSFHLRDIEDINQVAVLYNYLPETGTYEVGTDAYRGVKPEGIDYSAYRPGTNGALFGPQGGLRSHAADLSLFMLAHLNQGTWNGVSILKSETAKLMQQPHWSGYRREGFFKNAGLQFHITEDLIQGKRLIGHSGDAYGLLSCLYFHPEEQWGIIVIMNGLHQVKGQHVFFAAEEDLANFLYESCVK